MIRVEGGHPLRGRVRAAGAKNAALPALLASLLTDQPVRLERIPRIADVQTTINLIHALGKRVDWKDGVAEVHGEGELWARAPRDPVQRMRASFIALGPLLARCGEAWMPLPGGCAIGPRPVDLHLYGLSRLGARIEFTDGLVYARARRLRGATVWLDYPSVGATEHLLLTGALAEGTTTIINPAREPEVVDLGRLLERMGARVRWATDRVSIEGQPELGGACHDLLPDRIEAGTYLIAGVLTGGETTVTGVVPAHLQALVEKLKDAGASVELGEQEITARQAEALRAVDVTTWPYPGFPTDLQAPLMALLCCAEGESHVRETVFASRWGHVPPLQAMGASISIRDDTATIRGVKKLHGAEVVASDLRAGAALVLAALGAAGTTRIGGEEHLARGYESFLNKVTALGAKAWEET